MLTAGVAASTAIHFPSSPRYSVHGDAKTSHRRFFASPVVSKNALKWSALVGGHGFSLATRKGSKLSSRRVGGVRCEATVAEKETVESPAEKFEYQAEVSRLLDLIVHSLYSHKEVFLRELVSNASDALDKLRFLSVTDPSVLGDGGDLEIRIKPDKENGTITILDTGIGMTKEELIDCLGTIAQSGTKKFLEALKENKTGPDNNLIGQFGVGFYSAFLVADKVTVSTKSPKSDKQYVWEGKADTSSYIIREETDPENLIVRGTKITLYLKPDDKFDYADPERVRNLVKNYSQFVSFPIYTWQEKSQTKEVEDDSAEVKEGEEKKTKTVTEKYWDWELANETKPLWMRNPKEVASEEYNEFYKKAFNEFLDPLTYTHFTTEGEVEFRSVLYIPGMAPLSSEDIMNPKTKNIRLYVKRVFISDDFDGELFPRYLSFVKGVVDSNDLPLNVSREILQESRIVRIMKKRLVRKTFDMIQGIVQSENKDDYKKFCGSERSGGECEQVVESNGESELAQGVAWTARKKSQHVGVDIGVGRESVVAGESSVKSVGGGGMKRGKNFERNHAARSRKRSAKLRRMANDDWRAGSVDQGAFGCLSNDEYVQLKRSRAEVYVAENKLAAARAERELAGEMRERTGPDGSKSSVVEDESDGLLRTMASKVHIEADVVKARRRLVEQQLALAKAECGLKVADAVNVEALIERERTRVLLATEKNMVGVERAHASLVQSGDVVGERGVGTAETVLTGGYVSGSSISPSSSASLAAARKLAKDFEDLKAEHAELTRIKNGLVKKYDLHPDDPLYECANDKAWTLDSEGEPKADKALMDRLFPYGYSINTAYCAEGKGILMPHLVPDAYA